VPLTHTLATSELESTIVDRDVKRLAVKEQQDVLYAKTGNYSQVKRNGDFEGGLGAEQSILSALMDGSYEIHVYEAPCGKGWSIINYEYVATEITSSSTGKLIPFEYEYRHVYASGCEHDARTTNW
jgi:hypothetical protein